MLCFSEIARYHRCGMYNNTHRCISMENCNDDFLVVLILLLYCLTQQEEKSCMAWLIIAHIEQGLIFMALVIIFPST